MTAKDVKEWWLGLDHFWGIGMSPELWREMLRDIANLVNKKVEEERRAKRERKNHAAKEEATGTG